MSLVDDNTLFDVRNSSEPPELEQPSTVPILVRLYRWFLPVAVGEELRRARMVANVSLVVFIGPMLILLAHVAGKIITSNWLASQPSDYLFDISCIIVGGLALLLNRQGHTDTAAWGVILLLMGIIWGVLYLEGDPQANPISILTLLLIMMIAVTILNRTGIIIAFTLSGVMYTTLNILWAQGFLPERVVRETVSISVFTVLGWLIVSGIVLIIANSAQLSLGQWAEALERLIQEHTAELQHTKDRVEAILNDNPDGIFLLNQEGQIEVANPAGGTLLQYPVDELVDTTVFDLFASDELEVFKEAFNQVTDQGIPVRVETIVRQGNERTFDADIAMAPIHDRDGLTGVVCSIHDISTLKEVERMKTMFLSIAAHELRTPLTSVQGFSEILLTRELDPERKRRFMLFIRQQSRQLAKIIDDLLDISRIQSGHCMELKIEPCDITEVIERATLPFLDNLSGHKILVNNMDAPPTIYGDPARLEQVVFNLISNAIKYSPNGSEIRVHCQVDSNQLEVSVQDHGIGICKEDQKHVFDRFFRGETASLMAGGTGLGLTICKLIVEAHGGYVRIESTPAVGSTISFTVPIEQRDWPESRISDNG